MQLIQINEESLRKAGIPFKVKTLYRFKSVGKYPELFTKIGGRLLIIEERWDELVDQAIIKTDKRVAKLKDLKE